VRRWVVSLLGYMKVSFAYDHKNKMPYRLDTLGHGGPGNSLTNYRSAPHIRSASEAAMVQECCGGDLWRHRVGPGSIKGGINGI
jgi:hypothetical protein